MHGVSATNNTNPMQSCMHARLHSFTCIKQEKAHMHALVRRILHLVA
jgi:hypothetical protein